MATVSSSKKSNKTGLIIAIVVAIIVIGSLLFIFSSGNTNSYNNNQATGGGNNGGILDALAPSQVTVSGSATTSGQGMQITSIVFTGSSGNSYTATVNGGSYSIALPNPNIYTMNANWQGQYSWQTGSAPVTTPLTLNQGVGQSSSISDDLTLSLPNSVIALSGTVKTSGYGTSPETIIFNASNGQLFTASASGDTFSTTIPNMMTYKMEIDWQGLLGSSGTCNSGTLTIQTGVGVTSAQATPSC